MAWTVSITDDTDDPTVGSVTATFTPVSGSAFIFPITRLQRTVAKVNAYVTAAKAALAAQQTKDAARAQNETDLAAKLNAP